jgi:hypothetical protein
VRKKRVIRILLLPFELYQFWIRWYGAEFEVIEEWRGEADNIANLDVGFGIRLVNAI